MKKIFLYVSSVVACLLCAALELFAAGFSDFTDGINAVVARYGGWMWIGVIVVSFLVIWIIRATKTQKDDVILDKYVSVAIEYALKVMPQNTKIDWVKFVANALGKFSEIYTKTNELPPDAKLYDKVKQMIESIAEEKQLEQLKNSVG